MVVNRATKGANEWCFEVADCSDQQGTPRNASEKKKKEESDGRKVNIEGGEWHPIKIIENLAEAGRVIICQERQIFFWQH